MSGPSWQARIERAQRLAKAGSTATGILNCYAGILSFQAKVYAALSDHTSQSVDQLIPHFKTLLQHIPDIATQELAQAATSLFQTPDAWRQLLLHVLDDQVSENIDSAQLFFAYSVLQPYVEFLSEKSGPHSPSTTSVCPFCGNKPVLSLHRPEGDGGRRSLVCFLCNTEWQFRRILCPNCGEEDKEKLPVISAAEFDFVRLETCNTCKTYVKTIDMTKNGHAIPQVDEIAAMSLDLWASENGYTKLQRNLFGV